jgi:hypothetical protein
MCEYEIGAGRDWKHTGSQGTFTGWEIREKLGTGTG